MEKVSGRQLSAVITLVIISGILMSGGSDRSMQDSWIAAMTAVAVMVPIYFIYARITALFPGKGLFEIVLRVTGKYAGTGIILLMSLYAFYVGAMAMRIFSEFNQVVSMPETSQLLTLIIFASAVVYIVKKGVPSIGKFAQIALPVIAFLIIIINILSFQDWKLHHTLPLMYNVGKDFWKDVFTTSVFPIGEAVFVCALFGFKKDKGGNGKIFLKGLALGGGFLVLETLRSIMVLGANTISLLYYPSYTATGVINIMDFFTRIEVTISASFFVAQIVKVCLCLYVFSSGLGVALGAGSYKALVLPGAFAMTALALILFKSTVDSYEFLDVYKFYALLFQILLPVGLWIGAELVAFRDRRLSSVQV